MELRTAICFWLLGLCNNYGYSVMIAAAHDILSDRFHSEEPPKASADFRRECNAVSTGAVLLADILPSFFLKLLVPFLPSCINLKIALVVLFSVAGYIFVAESRSVSLAILGVVFTSIACGLGEVTLLSCASMFEGKVAISSWSSGTGGAGFFGSFTYASLSMILSPRATIWCLLLMPILMCFVFWVLLKRPQVTPPEDEPPSRITSFSDKVRYIPRLFKYMVPFSLVYFCQYFINMGLLELLHYENSWLNKADQFRWFQVDYQAGVFVSRSLIQVIEFNNLWLLAACQVLNVVLFTTEAVYSWVPHLALSLVGVFWEGFVGGSTYVNTFNRISKEIVLSEREFSVSATSFTDSVGISSAGFLAFPVHNAICRIPLN